MYLLSKTQGGITIGIRSMFGKKGHFGPRLVSLILHLAACSCLISLSLSLFPLSLLCLSVSLSLFSLFSLSLSLSLCLFSLSLSLSCLLPLFSYLSSLFFLSFLSSLSPPLLSWGMSSQGVKTYNFGTSSGTSSDTSSETLM